ncbi:MAG: biopolymer transporter ExbD [Candidatus Nitronauta litoralis]|uniref:Biopolymer transporter ExbD n=1 Tax=Candidatus Nitronauta litoralis TaxID=2705533 RepID=A0A7T0FZ18_9BACT|nr:MAG: biopolymer transporter ExbD [Candidatus Nitronauta litoralis]
MHFKREEEDSFALELTPLIDVVFLLLIFFMVSTAFVDFPRRMEIALPTSKSSSEDKQPSKMEIEMTVNKQIFLDGKLVTISELEKRVTDLPRPEKLNVLIRADKNLDFGNIVEVMGILQNAKVVDIGVATK